MLRKTPKHWLRIVEKEPVAPADDPAAIRRRIDAARRQRYSLFGGAPKQTQKNSGLFADTTAAPTQRSNRELHDAAMGYQRPDAPEKGLQWERHVRMSDPLDPNLTEPAPVDRRALLERHLEENGQLKFDVTDGGEDDLCLGGLSSTAYHNKVETLEIPEHSALHQTMTKRDPRVSKSRTASNSWAQTKHQDPTPTEIQRATNGEYFLRDGGYQAHFPQSVNFEDQPDHVQHTVSIYTKKKLYIDGVNGYHDIVTQREERDVALEALALLSQRCVDYIPEECRYSANLFDQRLGIQQDEPLAFAMSEAPTLQRVLQRCYRAGIIPAVPNTAQINEMVGPFSGYLPHRKHPSLGPYFGLLNLVSPVLLFMAHTQFPWAPAIYMMPRALYVFQHPALGEYRIGYKRRAEESQPFRFASRFSRDYRLEIIFATTDVQHVPYLGDAVRMTRYAEQRLIEAAPGTEPSQRSDAVSVVRTKLSGGLSADDESLLKQALSQTRSTCPRTF